MTMIGCFYRNGNLYVGEYVVSDNFISTDASFNKKEGSLIKEIELKKEEESTKTVRENEVNSDRKDMLVLFEGNGKYIKKDEIFVGCFEKNNYRKGIWVKYKNIHNLFFFMNIHEMILKETYNDNVYGKDSNILSNLQNILYFPLKEINVYVGEFENNMFNGLSLYYFHPFLYIGYFLNNQMNGYGYIFYIPTLKRENSENPFFSEYGLQNFLFTKKENPQKKTGHKQNKKETNIYDNNENENEKEDGCEKKKEEKKEINLKEGNVNEKDDECEKKEEEKKEKNLKEGNANEPTVNSFMKNIFEKLKILMNQKYKKKNKTEKKTLDTKESENTKNSFLIDKMEKEIYNNFQFQIRKKKKIKQLKDFFKNNEQENFFNIFHYITYNNLLFKGFFYNNRFSSNLNEQSFFRTKFEEAYKECIFKKIQSIRNDLLNNVPPEKLVKALNISEEHEFYLVEKKKKILQSKKKGEVKKNLKNNEETKKELKFECLKNIVDYNLLKNIFQLTNKSSTEYIVKVITDEQILKYKNKFTIMKAENKKIEEATINLNGYHQLVIINVKCKNEFNLNTNKGNFQNVSKIKMYLISSDVSSIINYNIFNVHYVFVYTKHLEKKGKEKNMKKKK